MIIALKRLSIVIRQKVSRCRANYNDEEKHRMQGKEIWDIITMRLYINFQLFGKDILENSITCPQRGELSVISDSLVETSAWFKAHIKDRSLSRAGLAKLINIRKSLAQNTLKIRRRCWKLLQETTADPNMEEKTHFLFPYDCLAACIFKSVNKKTRSAYILIEKEERM